MRELRSLWALVRRPEILAVLFVVFAADVVAGIIVPTFSLFAVSMGASLAMVGILTGAAGFTSIFASLPVGALSDSHGRKNILSGGILIFAVTSLLYTLVPTPLLLLPIRIVASLGIVSVFMVGIAYIGDLVTRQERGLAIGLYTTAMGLGFALGPALGGLVAARYGYSTSYRVAAVIAFAGWIVAMRWLSSAPSKRTALTPAAGRPSKWAKLRTLASEPELLGTSVANLGNNVAFTTIFSFLPLYAAGLSVGDAALGAMFAGRALASTGARLPTGMLSMRISSRYLMMAALGASALVLLAISWSTSPTQLPLLLMLDGIAYGIFLTAGQAHVTQLSAEEDRGAAVGVFSTVGSMGATVGPIVLGFFAGWFGLAVAFRVAAFFLVAVALTFWGLTHHAERYSYEK